MTETSRELSSLIRAARSGFAKQYGREPSVLAVSPGRVNFIGDHTDYSGGLSLPFAIDRYTVVAADRRLPGSSDQRPTVQVASQLFDACVAIPFDERPLAKSGGWSDYIAGVLNGFLALEMSPGPLDLYCHSSLPAGSGLASSAALEVATGLVIERFAGGRRDTQRLIDICLDAEHTYAGVPCGNLDPFSVTMAREGCFMLFDSRAESARHIPVPEGDIELVVINSGVKHSLADSAYSQRRTECAAAEGWLKASLRHTSVEAVDERLAPHDESLARRARHVVTENQRVVDTAAAFAAGDVTEAGYLMYASHESLAHDFEVSCTETDFLVDWLRHCGSARGILGARMTGGGFGGAVIVLSRPGALPGIEEEFRDAYRRATGLEFEWTPVRPVRGATLLND